jgi:hypothetical protein
VGVVLEGRWMKLEDDVRGKLVTDAVSLACNNGHLSHSHNGCH